MAQGEGGAVGGALKDFFIALGLDADAASWAAAESAVHGLEKALEVLVELAKEVAEVLAESVIGTAEYANELEDASERTGITTTELQHFAYQAKMAGASAEEFQTGMAHLGRKMVEARDGSEEAQKAFAKLHVRVTDGTGKLRNQEDVLADVADAIQKLPPGAERTAVAMDLFSRSGQRMVPILAHGAAGIRELNAEADQLGLGMDEEAIARASEFNKEIEKLTAVGQSLVREFAGPLIEALQPITEAMIEWVKANRELLRDRVQAFAQSLVRVGGYLATVLKGVWFVVSKLKDALAFLAQALKVVGVYIGTYLVTQFLIFLASVVPTTMAALIEMTASFVAMGVEALLAAEGMVSAGLAAASAWLAAEAPLWAIVALFAVLVLAAEDVYAYLNGYDSLIGDFGPKWEAWIREFFHKPAGEHWLTTILKAQFEWLFKIGDMAADLMEVWDNAPEWVRTALTTLAKAAVNPGGGFAGGVGEAGQVGAALGTAAVPGLSAVTNYTAREPAPGSVTTTARTLNYAPNVVNHIYPPAGSNPADIANEVEDRLRNGYRGAYADFNVAGGG